MFRFLSPVAASLLFAVSAPAWAASTSANLSIAVTQSQAISGVSLSNNSFAGGATSGTVVGAISVTMSPAAPAFSGTLSLSGSSASSFKIVGSDLQTNGVVPAGTYLINIVASQAGSMGSPFTQSETITATISTSCPDNDGSSGAAAGTANLPSILSGYAARINGPGGLGCKVAGVDYWVGVTPGTVLKNPRTAGLPAGCTLGSNTVTCSSNNTTIDGYDFGNNGVSLFIANGVSGTTISNNNFFVNANDNSGTGLNLGTFANGVAGNTLITKNHLGSRGAWLAMMAGAIATIQYNNFHGAWEDNWEIAGPSPSGSAQVIMKYNLFQGPKGGALGSGGHPDGIQFHTGNHNSPMFLHNTYYLPSGWDQPLHVEAQAFSGKNSIITNPVTAFNTIIVKSPGSANYLIACKQDGNPPTVSTTGYSAYGNYVDASGNSNHWSAGVTQYACSGSTYGTPYPNKGMITGQVCSTTPNTSGECR